MNVKKKMNSKGFTLVELMVVSAILSVLMLAFTGYMFQQAKQTKASENKQNFTQLKASVLNAASQPDGLTSSEVLQAKDL